MAQAQARPRARVRASPLGPLLPWMDALCDIGHLRSPSNFKSVRAVRETRILWVDYLEVEALVDVEGEDADMVEHAHEALEMLALLSYNGHYDAWAEFVMFVWPANGPLWLDLLPSWQTDGLCLGCHMSVETPDCFPRWAQKYVLTATSEESVAREARLRRLLSDTFSIPEHALLPASPVPTHLEMFPCGANNNRIDATTVHLEAASVARLQHARIKRMRMWSV